ncbi:MAG: hypothetical protein ACRENZ_00210 [Thermodesulfobacteriota bacterium]
MRLIINTVVVNEEETITTFLNNLRKIRDIWAVNILDGFWKQELNPTLNSTDRTKEIVQEWVSKHHVPFEVNYIESDHIWRTESEKRNYLLKLTHEKYGKCWIFVIDADETVKFPSGLVAVTLLPDIENQEYPGVLPCYAYNSVLVFPTVRLIPSGEGYHYHTERAMLVHDKDCNVVVDYNPNSFFQARKTFELKGMFLVNYWTLRKKSRQFTKVHYAMYQHGQNKESKCHGV